MTVPTERYVFHICSRAALAAARSAGTYRADSLESEGFIHLSRAHQVRRTARAYFDGVPDLVLLLIDPTLLTAPLVYEAPASLRADVHGAQQSEPHRDDLFPHCYGPINLAAIIDVIDLARFDEDVHIQGR